MLEVKRNCDFLTSSSMVPHTQWEGFAQMTVILETNSTQKSCIHGMLTDFTYWVFVKMERIENESGETTMVVTLSKIIQLIGPGPGYWIGMNVPEFFSFLFQTIIDAKKLNKTALEIVAQIETVDSITEKCNRNFLQNYYEEEKKIVKMVVSLVHHDSSKTAIVDMLRIVFPNFNEDLFNTVYEDEITKKKEEEEERKKATKKERPRISCFLLSVFPVIFSMYFVTNYLYLYFVNIIVETKELLNLSS
jgi:hypothetical protein